MQGLFLKETIFQVYPLFSLFQNVAINTPYANSANQRIVATAIPVMVIALTTSLAVNRPGGTPVATNKNHIVPKIPINATMQPAQLVCQAACGLPCISNEIVVVMPQEGHEIPVSVLSVQGGRPSCRCVP